MKLRTISPQEAAEFPARVHAAPVVKIEGEEVRFHVKRIGFLPPKGDLVTFMEMTDGKLYRLPRELDSWAHDLVSTAIVFHANPFPAFVRFGIVNGRHWVEID